jgi:hypothetical protein
MNERIRELAKQADLIRVLNEHAHEYGSGTFDNTPYPELEKFAELIVKETLQVARAGIEYGNGMEDAVYKYFGVGE